MHPQPLHADRANSHHDRYLPELRISDLAVRRLGLLAFAAVFASAPCAHAAWRAPNADAAASSQGTVSGPTGMLTTAWSWPWPHASFRNFGSPVALLADDNDGLFAVDVGIPELSANSTLFSWTASSGVLRWAVNVTWSWDAFSTLLLASTTSDGDVLVGRVSDSTAGSGCPASIAAWSATSGTALWQLCTPGGVSPTLVTLLSNTTVIAPLDNGTTLVLDAATGAVTASTPWGSLPWGKANFDAAVLARADGALSIALYYMESQASEIAVSRRVGRSQRALGDLGSGSGGANITVIDVSTGTTLWSSGASDPLLATHNGAVISLAPSNSTTALFLTARNGTDGALLWSAALPFALPIGLAVSRQGQAWVMQADDAVYATVLDAATGTSIASATLASPPGLTRSSASYTVALTDDGATAYAVVWWTFPDPADSEVIYAATLTAGGALELDAVGAALDDSSYLALGGNGSALYASGCYGVYAYA